MPRGWTWPIPCASSKPSTVPTSPSLLCPQAVTVRIPQPVIDAYRALIAAQPAARIIAVGGAGSLNADEAGASSRTRRPSRLTYYPEANAFATILQEFRNSDGVDWTVVAPSPEIAPGTRTGEYVTADDVPAGEGVSVEDFAIALIDEAENPTHRQARFTVASNGLA